MWLHLGAAPTHTTARRRRRCLAATPRNLYAPPYAAPLLYAALHTTPPYARCNRLYAFLCRLPLRRAALTRYAASRRRRCHALLPLYAALRPLPLPHHATMRACKNTAATRLYATTLPRHHYTPLLRAAHYAALYFTTRAIHAAPLPLQPLHCHC